LGANVQAPKNNKIDIAGLYREYGDMLQGFIAKKLPHNDAADLMHDAFVRVLCLADGYELRSPRPFLFRVVNNLILDHHKASRTKGDKCFDRDDSAGQPADNLTPEVSVYAQQRLIALQRAITELPPRCKQVFLLHKFEHQSHAAIADMLGISVNMVEKHVIRALAHCRQRLAGLD
jgi:RNA polymerase sigma-70 factor (ECF subfamily)